MSGAQFGMVGLGTMGRNLLLNVAEQGVSGAGYNIHRDKLELLIEESKGLDIKGFDKIADFIKSLETPRKIMLLVPAGDVVDSVIHDLLPHLERGDLIIDGGNSHFLDTERREIYLKETGIEFLGVGVSGGEEGARRGASIMIGGTAENYERVRPIFEAASAKVDGEPCAAHVGFGSAGHFVKMVHNGIEYGLMQILAETYDFMLRVLKMNYNEMSGIFARWNNAELNSFLVEITAEVLRKGDAETGKPLVEMILDKAAQKGTGKWTSQVAMDCGVPIPTIDAAVSMRQISSQKETRLLIAKKYGSLPPSEAHQHKTDGATVTSVPVDEEKAARAADDAETIVSEHHKASIGENLRVTSADGSNAELSEPPALAGGSNENLEKTIRDGGRNAELKNECVEDFELFIEHLKHTLLSSFIITYAQGMSLLQTASKEKNFDLNLAEIAKIWRGGCIIRSALLEEMRRAYAENPDLPNLMLDDKFAEILNKNREAWRSINAKFAESRIPSACLSSALAYFDAFRSERLPANLIQAQRDFFGAHTYQRTDKEGIFHTPDWNK